jgi:flagellar export protein FliJ
MTEYKFRLQSVLDLRTIERDQERGALAEAYGMLRTQAGSRAELLAEQQELQGRFRTADFDCGLDVHRLTELQRYEQVLRDRLQEIARQEEFWGNEIRQRQANLERAERDVKVMRQVDQRHLHHHQRRSQKLELQQLDEYCLRKVQFQQRNSS